MPFSETEPPPVALAVATSTRSGRGQERPSERAERTTATTAIHGAPIPLFEGGSSREMRRRERSAGVDMMKGAEKLRSR
jgi:hypothetical protein